MITGETRLAREFRYLIGELEGPGMRPRLYKEGMDRMADRVLLWSQLLRGNGLTGPDL